MDSATQPLPIHVPCFHCGVALVASTYLTPASYVDALCGIAPNSEHRPDPNFLPVTNGLAPEGTCSYCDATRARGETFFPSHAVRSWCQSGKRPHCTCDSCF